MKKAIVYFYNDPDDTSRLFHHYIYILDMVERGWDTKVVFEGPSVKIPGIMSDENHQLHKLYTDIKPHIDAVCLGCSKMMKVEEEVKAEGLPLVGDLKGHVGLPKYLEEGYDLVAF
jgi:hypothetical protein